MPPNNKKINFLIGFKNIFFPKGYPDSVTSDYLKYQIWDTIQAFCSTITGVFSTHTILKSVGVGNENGSVFSATIAWILKDGFGHFGKIFFAWLKGAELDINSKKWRLRADVLNDIASLIDTLVLPFYPDSIILLLCFTSILRAVVGVSGSATRAALTLHHAIRNNLADVTSKDNAQETFVNLIASLLSLLLLTYAKNQFIFSSIFLTFTLLHLFANVKAIKAVCLKTFNEARYLITLEEYFKSGMVLTPEQVNQMERITVGKTVSLNTVVKMGVCAKLLTEAYPNTYDLESITSLYDPCDLFIIAEVQLGIAIFFHEDIRPSDILKAFFFAASYIQNKAQIRDRYWEVQVKWKDFISKAKNQGKKF